MLKDWSALPWARYFPSSLCSSLPWASVQLFTCVWLFVSHGLQHTRPPCPSPAPKAYSNLCPSNQWCHPNISASFLPCSSCLQSFLTAGSFPVSQFSASSGQSIGASPSALVLPVNIQDWFPLQWTSLFPLQSKGLSRVFPTPQFKSIDSLVLSFLYSPTLTSIHDCWEKT